MKICPIEDSRIWDQFVRNCPGASYGHLYGWRKVIESAYGHKSLYLAGMKNGKIAAVLPMIRMKRPFRRPEWTSLPFFHQAGVLASDPGAGIQLLTEAGGLIGGRGPGSVSVRQNSRCDLSDLGIGGQLPQCFHEKIGMQIPLAATRQAMLKRFPSKLRSQIRKGLKNGLTWDIGKVRLLDDFYRVFSRNMRDLGSPVHSKFFFETILSRFSSDSFICVVYHGKRPVAAAFMFRFKNRIANPWASSVRDFRYLNTNMVLYWQMIGFACNLGMDLFDMGRSSRGASTHRFKQQWGPTQHPLAWYTWHFHGHSPLNQTLCLPPWRRLPLWGANLAGPWIRKYISL